MKSRGSVRSGATARGRLFLLVPITLALIWPVDSYSQQKNRIDINKQKTVSEEIFAREADRISQEVAENIQIWLSLLNGESKQRPDSSIYHYEALPPQSRSTHDEYLWKTYKLRWNELSPQAREDYNDWLSYQGQADELRIVKQIGKAGEEYFRREVNSYKTPPDIWIKAKLLETFSANQFTLDREGQVVNKYDNIWAAGGGAILGVFGFTRLTGLDGAMNKITDEAVRVITKTLVDHISQGAYDSAFAFEKEIPREDEVKALHAKYKNYADDADATLDVITANDRWQSNSIRAAEGKAASSLGRESLRISNQVGGISFDKSIAYRADETDIVEILIELLKYRKSRSGNGSITLNAKVYKVVKIGLGKPDKK